MQQRYSGRCRPGRDPRRPPRQHPRRFALILLVWLLLSTTGCSAVSMAWGYLDHALAERVDAWVDLRPDQRERLEQQLDHWLQGLAIERLPEYSALVRELARRGEDGFGTEDARWAHGQLRGHYGRLLADATGWIAQQLAELDPEQIVHLKARMRARNAEYRSRYLDVTRRASRRALAERLIEAIERWSGRLDRGQTELIHRGVHALPDASMPWYQYRLRMQAGLLSLLRSGADAGPIRAHLRAWWIEQTALPDTERATFRRFERELVVLLGELAHSLSPKQLAAVDYRLRRLADGLETIERNARLAEGSATE